MPVSGLLRFGGLVLILSAATYSLILCGLLTAGFPLSNEVVIAVEKATMANDYYFEPNNGDQTKLARYRHGLRRGANYLYFDGHVELRMFNAELQTQLDPWTVRGVGCDDSGRMPRLCSTMMRTSGPVSRVSGPRWAMRSPSHMYSTVPSRPSTTARRAIRS